MGRSMADYWRSVALVFSGTAFAQAIPLLGSLFLARLFIPSDFGVFTAWLGLAAIAAVLVTGRFEMALALEPDGLPRRRAALATLCIAALVTLAFAVVFVLARLSDWFDTPLGFDSNLEALLLPAVAALALAQIVQAWAAADGAFRLLASVRIVQATLVTGLQIGAGLLAPSPQSLALSHIIGVLTAGLIGLWHLRPGQTGQPVQHSIQYLIRRYFRFPLFALPADTLNTAAVQLPVIVVTGRFGAEVGGFLALGMRTLGAPISLMGTAILDVFKRRASESWRTAGHAREIYDNTFVILTAGSAAATLLFLVYGEALFAWAFGETWREAGRIVVWMLPLFSLRFIASPLSYMFYIAQKQHLDLVWQMALFAMTITTLNIFSAYDVTLQTYAWGYGALYVLYIAMSYHLSRGAAA